MTQTVDFTSGVGFLLSVIKHKPSIYFLSEHKLSKSDFVGFEQKLLETIQSFVGKFQAIPDIEQVEVALDTPLPKLPSGDPVYWATEVHNRSLSTRSVKVASDIVRCCGDGNLDSITGMLDRLRQEFIDRSQSSNITPLNIIVDEVLDRHDILQKSPGLPGITFGMDYLDAVSGGCQKGDFIIVVGRPSTGKTFVMLNMAMHAHNSGKNVAWVVTEMTKIQYATRMLALRTQLNSNRIRWGRLSGLVGRKKLIEEIERMKEFNTGFNFIQSGLTSDITRVISDIRSCKPDIVYIDAAYLLQVSTKSRYERVSDGADMLKNMAQSLEIPVVASYQFKKHTTGSMDDIYQSDVMTQLGSVVLGIKDDKTSGEESWGKKKFKIISILKGREGETGAVRILFDMDYTSITQVEVLKGEDLEDFSGSK
jgi:replicative DNA helicase